MAGMPTTYNGIGTRYYGSKNAKVRKGICQGCGSAADLKSYDTRLMFCVVFIPLISQGLKRVIDQCSRCTNHMAMPLEEFNYQRTAAMAKVSQVLSSGSPTEDDVGTAIASTAAFGTEDDMSSIMRLSTARFAGSFNLRLIEADTFQYLCRPTDERDSLSRALAIKDDAGVRERLGLLLMMEDKLEDARQVLGPLVNAPSPVLRTSVMRLVEQYQAQGNHRAALDLLGKMDRAPRTPEQDKYFQKVRQASETNQHTGKKVKPSYNFDAAGRAIERTPFFKRASGRITLVLGLAATAGWLGFSAYLGVAHPAFFVNNSGRSYSIDINGTVSTLDSGSWMKVRMPVGTTQVKVRADGLDIAPIDVNFESPFIKRAFSRPTVVINPDRQAIIRREEVIYRDTRSSRNFEQTENPTEFFSGDSTYEFSGIDFEFATPPREISLKNRDSEERRVLVDVEKNVDVASLLRFANERQNEKLGTIAGALLSWHGGDPKTYDLLSDSLQPAQLLEAVAPLLDDRPVNVPAHRIHQKTKELVDPAYDGSKEYEGLLAADPTNRQLMYLAGRVSEDRRRAADLFRQASSGDSPDPFALHARSYEHLKRGEMEQAVMLGRKAHEAVPTDGSVAGNYQQALIATDRHEEALRVLDRTAYGELGWRRLATELTSRFRTKGAAGCDEAVEHLLSLAKRDGATSELIAGTRAEYKFAIAYMSRNTPEMAKWSRISSDPVVRFAHAVTLRQVEKAATCLNDAPDSWWFDYLTLYVLARMEGDSAADKVWGESILRLSAAGPDGAALAAWLSGSRPDVQVMLDFEASAAIKRIVLTAAAARYPAGRSDYLNAARRYNFELIHPHQLIERAISELPALKQ
jgi:hypothetical protein